MRLATRMSRLGSETAFEVLARAKALERTGRHIIHLEIGEPDFDTPEEIVEAARKALSDGYTHYVPAAGIPEEDGQHPLLDLREERIRQPVLSRLASAFTPGSRGMGAMRDYVMFVGGYGNTRTRFRLFGDETSDAVTMMSPGEHTMQLSRRGGLVWGLFDGTPILWAKDPHPDRIVNRLAALGGYGGEQVLHEMRIKVHSSGAPAEEGAE